jgi:hypothetical protein
MPALHPDTPQTVVEEASEKMAAEEALAGNIDEAAQKGQKTAEASLENTSDSLELLAPGTQKPGLQAPA